MKFITNVDLSFSFKQEFDDHIKKFDLKHQQELLFLDDVQSFLEKRSKIQSDFAKMEIDLCEQYLHKKYKLIDESNHEVLQAADAAESRSLSGEWKIFLEQLEEICEKRQASSYYVTLFYKEYHETVKKQKTRSHEQAIKDIKEVQNKIQDAQETCRTAFKRYCFEEYLNDRLNMKSTNRYFNQAYFDQRLKERAIDPKYFESKFEKIYTDPNESLRIRNKQVDLTKLNYFIHNSVLNQLMQHYVSCYLPEMLILDNGQLDVFIDELVSCVKIKEIEISRLIFNTFNEGNLMRNAHADQENDWAYSNKTVSFHHLTQFLLEPYNPDKEDFSTATLKSEHAKYFTYDYQECLSKLNRLDQEISQLMISLNSSPQIPESLNDAEPEDGFHGNKPGDDGQTLRFILDPKIEADKYSINSIKFQTVALQSRIDVLESFEISREIEKNDNVIYTYGEILHSMNELEDLLIHQCLFYVESYVRTIDKPFPDMRDQDDYNLLYESWL